MADADGKMRMEKMRITKKVRGKKREMRMAKNINKQTIKERNLSFKSLSHGWTLRLHRERDAFKCTHTWCTSPLSVYPKDFRQGKQLQKIG